MVNAETLKTEMLKTEMRRKSEWRKSRSAVFISACQRFRISAFIR
jgi:hypothetical protein